MDSALALVSGSSTTKKLTGLLLVSKLLKQCAPDSATLQRVYQSIGVHFFCKMLKTRECVEEVEAKDWHVLALNLLGVLCTCKQIASALANESAFLYELVQLLGHSREIALNHDVLMVLDLIVQNGLDSDSNRRARCFQLLFSFGFHQRTIELFSRPELSLFAKDVTGLVYSQWISEEHNLNHLQPLNDVLIKLLVSGDNELVVSLLPFVSMILDGSKVLRTPVLKDLIRRISSLLASRLDDDSRLHALRCANRLMRIDLEQVIQTESFVTTVMTAALVEIQCALESISDHSQFNLELFMTSCQLQFIVLNHIELLEDFSSSSIVSIFNNLKASVLCLTKILNLVSPQGESVIFSNESSCLILALIFTWILETFDQQIPGEVEDSFERLLDWTCSSRNEEIEMLLLSAVETVDDLSLNKRINDHGLMGQVWKRYSGLNSSNETVLSCFRFLENLADDRILTEKFLENLDDLVETTRVRVNEYLKSGRQSEDSEQIALGYLAISGYVLTLSSRQVKEKHAPSLFDLLDELASAYGPKIFGNQLYVIAEERFSLSL
jgi:hypothetical protein